MPSSRLARVAVGLLIGLAACAEAPASPGRDLPTWTVSPEPVLRIGDEDDAPRQFHGVRGVVRMPSGDLVVADRASAELRHFSATGAYQDRLSRRGQGSGDPLPLTRWSRPNVTLPPVSRPGGRSLATIGGFSCIARQSHHL